jgi:hypothetical protein
LSQSNTTKPWGAKEKAKWLAKQAIKRSYHDEVETKIQSLSSTFEAGQYGTLNYPENQYPLYFVKSLNWDDNKKTILITGGVHGYETSGVQGALQFMVEKALNYPPHFNILVLPCISPWGYETINRWNPNTVDPNRSFTKDSLAEEAKKAMDFVLSTNANILAHFDLHETTDTDNTEFRPALSARDAIEQDEWDIPDGFYLVGNSENTQNGFQAAIIQAVEKVTHIAPSDESGKIIGDTCTQKGVINYDVKKRGLCTGFTGAEFVTTTEVYPDSPRVNDDNCIAAQVAAVTGGLDYLIRIC